MIEAIIWAVVIIQIQGFVYSIYVHRYKCHQLISLHPVFEHFCLLLIWLTSPQLSSPYWIRKSAARHLKHHHHADQEQDPHSPKFFKLLEIVSWNKSTTPGGCYYISDQDVHKYGKHVSLEQSKIAQHLYFKLPPYAGMVVSSVALAMLLGTWSILPMLLIWGLPITSGLLTIYLAHKFGYQNYKGENNAMNSWPLAVLQWGEELHNNHHHNHNAKQQKANFASKWWELDLGYVTIWLLSLTKLVKARNVSTN